MAWPRRRRYPPYDPRYDHHGHPPDRERIPKLCEVGDDPVLDEEEIQLVAAAWDSAADDEQVTAALSEPLVGELPRLHDRPKVLADRWVERGIGRLLDAAGDEHDVHALLEGGQERGRTPRPLGKEALRQHEVVPGFRSGPIERVGEPCLAN